MDVSRENSNSNLNSNQKTSKSSKSFRFGLAELADESINFFSFFFFY